MVKALLVLADEDVSLTRLALRFFHGQPFWRWVLFHRALSAGYQPIPFLLETLLMTRKMRFLVKSLLAVRGCTCMTTLGRTVPMSKRTREQLQGQEEAERSRPTELGNVLDLGSEHRLQYGENMATYVITDTPVIDWATVNWDNLLQFKYRNESSKGQKVAQAAFDERRAAGQPTVLWRFDDDQNPPTLVDRCNV